MEEERRAAAAPPMTADETARESLASAPALIDRRKPATIAELDAISTAIATADQPDALYRAATGLAPCDCDAVCECVGDTAAKLTARRRKRS